MGRTWALCFSIFNLSWLSLIQNTCLFRSVSRVKWSAPQLGVSLRFNLTFWFRKLEVNPATMPVTYSSICQTAIACCLLAHACESLTLCLCLTAESQQTNEIWLFCAWTITARQVVLCLAQMKYKYFVTARRTRFFHVQAIKIGHILIIYRQTGDTLSVSSKGTAAAKWWMKISR